MITRPFVPVIIPAHNADRYLRETLGGVFAQGDLRLEIIVVGDGSKPRVGLLVP